MDEYFHIYLCFGQSNMEGNAQWESPVDENVDERFQMLATCDFENPHRTVGEWYVANCPIVSPTGKLGPTDYFTYYGGCYACQCEGWCRCCSDGW